MSTSHLRRGLMLAAKLAPVLAIAASAVYFRKLAPVDARTADVSSGPVDLRVTGTGTLESVSEAQLSFEAPGRIVSLAVDQGDRVTAGQLLGTLDPVEPQQRLSVALANRDLAAAAIGRAEAELERARATRVRAAADADRAKALFESGSIARAEWDAAKEKLATIEAELRSLDAAKLQASHGSRVAERTVTLEERHASDVSLRSPIDGLVVKRTHEVGDVLAAGMPAFTVVSLSKLWVRAWIDETALGRLAIGQPATVELRSHPGRPVAGRVDRIGREADRQTHELLVDVALLEVPSAFAIGQRADVFITTESKPGAVRVPAGFCDVGSGACLVERRGRAVKETVRLGLVGSDFVEVETGLVPGERVVGMTFAGEAIPEGRRIRVRN